MVAETLPAVKVEWCATLPSRGFPGASGTIATPSRSWVDVSSRCRLDRGITITRGRQEEQGVISPSTCSIALDDTDGGVSSLQPGHMLRVSIAGMVRFVGEVTSAPLEWPNGGREQAVLQVTCSDVRARLGATRLRSIIEEEVLLDRPLGYWPLTDSGPVGSDISGNGMPDLVPAFSSGEPLDLNDAAAPKIEWRGGTGPATDGQGALKLTARMIKRLDGAEVPSLTDGGYLQTEPFELRSGTLTLEMVIASQWEESGPPPMDLKLVGGHESFQMTGESPTRTTVYPFATWPHGTGATTMTIGNLTTRLAAEFSPTTIKSWVNGSSVPSSAFQNLFSPIGQLRVGAAWIDWATGGMVWSGTISHVALYESALPASRHAAHAAAVTVGLASGTGIHVPIGRLLDFAGVPTGERSLAAGRITTPAHADTTGQSVDQLVAAYAASENAWYYVDRSGLLVVRPHAWGVKPAFTVDASMVDVDVSVTRDTQGIVNESVVDGPSSSARAEDVESQGAYGRRSTSLTVLSTSPADAAGMAGWLTYTQSQPFPRLPVLPFDLLTLPDPSLSVKVQQLDMGSVFTLAGLPAQSLVGSSVDVMVQGYTEQVSRDTWSIAFNVTSAAPGSAEDVWILEDPTYGHLETTHRLAY